MNGAEQAHAVVGVLAAVTGLGAAVVGGVFFAFSGFVMRGLADAGQDAGDPATGAGTGSGTASRGTRVGIAAMQAINRAAVRPPLMVLLFGTLLAGLATCILLLAVVGGGHALWWGIAGEVVYLGGVVVMTVSFHVPRNDELARLDPGAETADGTWQRYVMEWARGNHVRALAGVLAGALFGVAAFVVGAPLLVA